MSYLIGKKNHVRLAVTSVVLLAAADSKSPKAPTSPKATDALRIDAAAISKATQMYWFACEDADKKLKYQLALAADAAHKRNDGVEEQACLDAEQDVAERIDFEMNGRQTGHPAPIKPLRFEQAAK